MALERVREANETLRRVRGAPPTGLRRGRGRHRGAGRARRGRPGERGVLRGWSASIARDDRGPALVRRWPPPSNGADAASRRSRTPGRARVQREGQPLYLESRTREIPTDPPRRLLLVRDVTAGRVADQTIRSLFQFLQDRDEDRTRLLRRTNAAIEAERNRIARDLHDGPVQGVSAASLSLEAALLMIKAGDADRGPRGLSKVARGAGRGGRRPPAADVGPAPAGPGGARADPGAPRDGRRGSATTTASTTEFTGTPAPRGPARTSRRSRTAWCRRRCRTSAKHARRGHGDRCTSRPTPRSSGRDRGRRRRASTPAEPGVPAGGDGSASPRCANGWSSRAGPSWSARRPGAAPTVARDAAARVAGARQPPSASS